MRQVCQLCASDDDVTWIPIGPDLYEYTCTNVRRHRHGKTHVWQGTKWEVLAGAPSSDGPAAELGMLEDLQACLVAGEAWVEYGVVEDRYSKLNPEAFGQLRERYGHAFLGPTVNPRHTASVYIARVLGMLRDRDILAFDYGTATGHWAYNGRISYWAKPLPGPPKSRRLTFADYNKSS